MMSRIYFAFWIAGLMLFSSATSAQTISIDGEGSGVFESQKEEVFFSPWHQQSSTDGGLLELESVTSEGQICPDGTTLIMTGRVRYAEPGCSEVSCDEDRPRNLCITTSGKITCSNVPVDIPEPTLPPPTELPNVEGCFDKPLRRVRVELWKDDDFPAFPGPSSGDKFLVSTLTDGNGLFAFCRTSAPNDAVDLYVSVKTCADGNQDGDACGTFPGSPTPFSVVTTTPSNEVFTTNTLTAEGVCTGNIHWDIVDRRALHNGGQQIFDLLANDAFDFLENEVGWRNDLGLHVRFPDGPTGFTTPDEIAHIASGDEQDIDLIFKTYAYFVLYQLYEKEFPPHISGCTGHDWGVDLDSGCAWVNGWSYFLQAAIQVDPDFEDTPAPGNIPDLQIDIETPNPEVKGKTDEGSVAATLWDIFDNQVEDWDSISLGLPPIWELVEKKPSDICEFVRLYNSSYNENPDISSILKQHRISCLEIIPIQSVYNKQPDIESQGLFALVAGKDLVIRVFHNTGELGPEAEAEAKLCIDGSLEECTENRLFVTEGRLFPVTHEFSVEERRRAEESLNFFIQRDEANELLTPGRHSFFIEVKQKNNGDFSPITGYFEAVFNESPLVNVFLIPILLSDENGIMIGPEDSPEDGLDFKDFVLLERADEFLKTVYPINEESVTLKIVNPYFLNFGTIRDSCETSVGPDPQKIIECFTNEIWLQLTTHLFEKDDVEKLFTKSGINLLIAVVNNKIGKNSAPLDRVAGISRLGFTWLGQKPPKVVFTLDRTPQDDPTIERQNEVILGSTIAHEIGHLVGFGDEYWFEGWHQPKVIRPHPADTDENGTSAGWYLREEEYAFDVSGTREILKALNQGEPLPEEEGLKGSPVFVSVESSEGSRLFNPDSIAKGAAYGYMGGTGRGCLPLNDPDCVIQGLGRTLEGAGDLRSWTTSENYQKLYEILYPEPIKTFAESEDVSIAATSSPADASPEKEQVYVFGSVKLSGEVTLQFYRAFSNDFEIFAPPGSRYSIQFKNADDVVLDEIFFDLPFVRDDGLDGIRNVDRSPFGIIAEFPPNSHSLAMLEGTQVLGTLVKSPNAPIVEIESARLTGNELKITWNGFDEDGDPLAYLITYSPNGKDMFLLASSLPETSLTANIAGISITPSTPEVNVRASDGFNVADDASTVDTLISVPDVTGLSQAEAEAAIISAGLVIGTATTTYSAIVPAGYVISQNPRAGTEVTEGKAVDLVISSGPITIDIKPRSYPNSINLKSKGVIPVAVLTTDTLDATTVNPLSVQFGPNGAMEAHGKGHIEDADADGDNDLVLHFRIQETGLACGDTSAFLRGETFDGQLVEGSDLIKTVGCK